MRHAAARINQFNWLYQYFPCSVHDRRGLIKCSLPQHRSSIYPVYSRDAHVLNSYTQQKYRHTRTELPPSRGNRQRSNARDPSGLAQCRLTLPRRAVSLHSILNAMGLSAVEQAPRHCEANDSTPFATLNCSQRRAERPREKKRERERETARRISWCETARERELKSCSS